MKNLLLSTVNSTAPFDFSAVFGNVLQNWYYYLTLLIVIAGIIVFFAFVKPKRKILFSGTKKIVYTAVFTALSFVANSFSYFPVSYISISVLPTVCFLSGLLLGAKSGFLVGFIGDLLGAIIFPAGAYNPLIGIASGLSGLIPGVIFDYFKGNGYIKTVISFVLTLVICTSGINTFALYLMYGLGKKTFWAYLIVRLPWQVLIAAGNLVLSLSLFAAIGRIFPKDKFTTEEADSAKYENKKAINE